MTTSLTDSGRMIHRAKLFLLFNNRPVAIWVAKEQIPSRFDVWLEAALTSHSSSAVC